MITGTSGQHHNMPMPSFGSTMENVTVIKGRDASFTCVVLNIGPHRVKLVSKFQLNYFFLLVEMAANEKGNDDDGWLWRMGNKQQSSEGWIAKNWLAIGKTGSLVIIGCLGLFVLVASFESLNLSCLNLSLFSSFLNLFSYDHHVNDVDIATSQTT